MAFSEEEREKMVAIRNKYPDLSILDLKQKILEEANIKVSQKTIHRYFYEKTQQNDTLAKNDTRRKLIVGKTKAGKNLYDNSLLGEKIDELYVKGHNVQRIASELGVSHEKVNSYLYRQKNEAGETRAKELQKEIETKNKDMASKLISKIIQDRDLNYDKIQEIERGIIDATRAELVLLVKQLKKLNEDAQLDEEELKKLQRLFHLTKQAIRFTRETVGMLKDLNLVSKGNEQPVGGQTTVENAEKMVVINEYLEGILNDDD